MSIEVSNLLTQKARKFGTSEGASDFMAIFLDGLNYVLNDINIRTYQDIDTVASTEGSINIDEALYGGLISLGLDFYIGDQGQWTVQGLDGIEAKYMRKLADVQTRYLQTLDLSIKFGDLDT